MNFDLWCQQQAGLPPARCDRRTDADEAVFEAYRQKVDRYETPHLQQEFADARLDHDLLNKDPVDDPITKDMPAQMIQTPAALSANLPAR